VSIFFNIALRYILQASHPSWAVYELTFSRKALKGLRRMPRDDGARMRAALGKLSEDPDRGDLDVRRLTGRPGFRLRVGGFRAIFERDDAVRVIAVERIAPRGDVYKR
jgi:mRNA interferase RelE/StbE